MATPGPYEPCPCGSDKKYKWCCRDRDRAAADAEHAGDHAPAPEPEVIENPADGSRIVQRGGNTYRVSANVDRQTLEKADAHLRQRGQRRGR